MSTDAYHPRPHADADRCISGRVERRHRRSSARRRSRRHRRSGVKSADIQEVIFGCVLPAGLGQRRRGRLRSARAYRRARHDHGQQDGGSGLKAIMMAADQLRTGDIDIALQAGSSRETNAPYLLPKARAATAWAPGRFSITCSPTACRALGWQLMGTSPKRPRRNTGFSRADQECVFAGESVSARWQAVERRVRSRDRAGHVKSRKGETVVGRDADSLHLRHCEDSDAEAAFKKDGTVTRRARLRSPDGAAALVLASAATVKSVG